MSALDRVRKKYGHLARATSKGPSAGSADPMVSLGTSPLVNVRPLSADLDCRIRAMAGRWEYTSTELAEVLELARADPSAWLTAVAFDEQRDRAHH